MKIALAMSNFANMTKLIALVTNLLLSGSRLAARYGEPGNATAVSLTVASKTLPVLVSVSHVQRIQTRAFFL